MITRHHATRLGLLASLGAAASLLLSGCGGTTTSASSLRPTVASGPTIYGLQAEGVVDGAYEEISGLASSDATSGYLTAATAFTGTTLQAYGGVPLGFAPNGAYVDSSIGAAVTPGSSVIFGAAISNGNNTTTVIPINPSSVVLTSSEVSGFSQSLSFVNSTTGPLANATYRTAPFTLPFTTTGMHSLTASVSDTAGNTGTTTFQTVVLANGDAAAFVAVTDPTGAAIAGATVSITGADAPGYVGPGSTASTTATNSVTDPQGVGIVFAKPGAAAKDGTTNTVTITLPKSTTTFTQTVTLTAGKATIVTATQPAATGSARKR